MDERRELNDFSNSGPRTDYIDHFLGPRLWSEVSNLTEFDAACPGPGAEQYLTNLTISDEDSASILTRVKLGLLAIYYPDAGDAVGDSKEDEQEMEGSKTEEYDDLELLPEDALIERREDLMELVSFLEPADLEQFSSDMLAFEGLARGQGLEPDQIAEIYLEIHNLVILAEVGEIALPDRRPVRQFDFEDLLHYRNQLRGAFDSMQKLV